MPETTGLEPQAVIAKAVIIKAKVRIQLRGCAIIGTTPITVNDQHSAGDLNPE